MATKKNDQPIETAEGNDFSEAPLVKTNTLPDFRRCPQHANYYPEEDPMRPISEFRITKEGKVHPVWCKRCTTKKQADYRKGRTGAASDQQNPLMKTLIVKLQQRVVELAALVDTDDDGQLDELADDFADYASSQVREVLAWYAARRQELPDRVFDQRHTEAE